MPDFAPAISASVTDCVITVSDDSNYSLSTEGGFEQADFMNYTAVEIVRPYDGAIARYNTAQADLGVGGDIVVSDVVVGPATTPLVQAIPESFAFVNGEYTLHLITAPTYDNLETYGFGDVVYTTGALYVALINSPGLNPPISADWALVTEAQIKAEPIAYAKVYQTGVVTVSCIVENTILFEATMVATGDTSSDISISEDGSEITFVDHSNYGYENELFVWVGTDENGHQRSQFTGYRKITVTRPDDTEYVLGTVEFDQEITAPSTGNMSFVWEMATTDKDGLYDVVLCAIPSWQEDTLYNSLSGTNPVIVYHSAKLWKALQANLNSEPIDGSLDWEEFTGELEGTRYCFSTKFMTTTRDIVPCKNGAVKAVLCRLTGDPCNPDLRNSSGYRKAMDLEIALDGISRAFVNEDWSTVDELFNFAHTLCCGCDGDC